MKTPEMTGSTQAPLDIAASTRYWLRAAWTRIGPRRALIAVGITAAGGGLALNWSWLTAIGVAPILLSIAPCAAMCAIGLCMPKMMGGSSCAPGPKAGIETARTAASEPGPGGALSSGGAGPERCG